MKKLVSKKGVLLTLLNLCLKVDFICSSRIVKILTPRLGRLNQYVPRPISKVSHYARRFVNLANPTLSIVTPSYQQAEFIERTLKSVLNQGYPNLEYFVQDGGSTDGTQEVLIQFGNRLSGFQSSPDAGQSNGINIGFNKTSGEIMSWLNADDIMLPGTLDRVVDFFNNHPEVDVVYGNRLMIDKNDMEIGRWILPSHDSNVLSWVDFVPQETLFWRRGIWNVIGGQIDESFHFTMDWDLLLRFRNGGAKFAHIPHFLSAFRVHENQKTSSKLREIGYAEIDLLRLRELGWIPSCKEIDEATLPFLARHVMADLAYRIKTRLMTLL